MSYLDASVSVTVLLLTGTYLLILMLTTLFVSPVAFYAVNQWLRRFAYHLGIFWVLGVLAELIAPGFALLTISFQSFEATLVNPVKSLSGVIF